MREIIIFRQKVKVAATCEEKPWVLSQFLSQHLKGSFEGTCLFLSHTQDKTSQELRMLSSVTLNCQAGWHKLWQAGKRLARTNRIFEDQEISQGFLSRSEVVLISRSSVLNPWSLVLNPWSSVLSPQFSVLNPWSSVLNPWSSVLSPQSSVLGPQSLVIGPQSLVLSPQSSIRSPQSSVLNPRSSVLGH